MPKKKELIGQKFGRLIVTKEAPPYYTSGGNKKTMWYCDCDCGTKDIIVRAERLLSGVTVSCGCRREETLQEFPQNVSNSNKKYNKYDLLSYDYGVGWTHNTNEEFYFDKEDYNLIKNYCWYENAQGYIVANIFGNKEKCVVFMHRLVLALSDKDKNKDVDHIKHHIKDNRKSELRITTHSQNCCNRKLPNNNVSGTVGVCYKKTENVWVAYITLNGKQILKRCNSKEDAIKVRKQLEEQYFKEYSYDNSIKIYKEDN